MDTHFYVHTLLAYDSDTGIYRIEGYVTRRYYTIEAPVCYDTITRVYN